MGQFIIGILVGGLGVFLVLSNNPTLAAKLNSVKKIIKKEIEDKVKGL
jgi:uncharacterized membrane protein YgaE (UPF0421/DUF939 family)|tara:strand:+ start:188 stop:331 length:144 start_codon:yes stop_codon:yes gene_type:complete